MEEDLIGCRTGISFGMPTLRGRRLTVYDIVTKLKYERSIDLALKDYEITVTEALAACDYCRNLRCKIAPNRIHFCYGCVLRIQEEESVFNREDYVETDKGLTIYKGDDVIYLGNLDELEEESCGKAGWEIASEMYLKLKDKE